MFIAPRGLITILLFYTIPKAYQLEGFDEGILLYTILLSSLIMTVSLIIGKNKNLNQVIHDYDDLQTTIESSLEDGHLDILDKPDETN